MLAIPTPRTKQHCDLPTLKKTNIYIYILNTYRYRCSLVGVPVGSSVLLKVGTTERNLAGGSAVLDARGITLRNKGLCVRM